MQVTIKGCTGPVNTFVVEPFVPHKEEYYLCIQSNRLDIDVSFSTAGGVEIEDNWDKVKTISIPTATAITGKLVDSGNACIFNISKVCHGRKPAHVTGVLRYLARQGNCFSSTLVSRGVV